MWQVKHHACVALHESTDKDYQGSGLALGPDNVGDGLDWGLNSEDDGE